MSKKIKIHNIWIYVWLFCFAILCLAGAYCFHDRVDDSGNVPFYLEVAYGDSEIKVYPWRNDADGKYYVFLPAGCREVRFQCENYATLSLDNLRLDKEITSDMLLKNEEYTGYVENNAGLKQSVSLVFMKSENIPALFISTESGSMDYINAQKGNAESGSFFILSEDGTPLSNGPVTSLKGRGNTSWTDCEKRGYKFTLPEAESLLGLRQSVDWILIANARSNYLSNSIAFWLEEELGFQYYTKAEFVDLYFNGVYHGNYILCEKISTGDNGIPLQDLDTLNMEANSGESLEGIYQYEDSAERFKAFLWKRDPEDITGGFLIERDVPEYYADEKSGIMLTTGDHYVIHKPSKPTVAEAEYLWGYMEEMHEAVASPDGYNKNGRYYTEYLDAESFALKYVLEEFLAFNDAGRSSAYYYKDSGDILKAGPGWDFEGAFLGNAQYLTMLNGTSYSTELFEQLMQHDDFLELVTDFYKTRLRPAIVKLCDEKLYELRNRIAESAEMDRIRWSREDFFDSCDVILSWIRQRTQFLDQHLISDEEWLCLKFVSEWSNHHYLYLHPGESVTQEMISQFNVPQVTDWMYQNGSLLQYGVPQYEDATLHGISQSGSDNRLSILMEYVIRVLPELLFGLLFLIAGVLYFIQTRQGRWKK